MRFAALAGVSVAVTIALLVPAVTGRDGFPVSTHPMYATTRVAEADFVTAVAFDTGGGSIALSMQQIAATDDPLIAETRMRRAARDQDRAGAACADIIDRLSDSTSGNPIDRVEIVRVRHDVAAFAAGDREADSLEVIATCTP